MFMLYSKLGKEVGYVKSKMTAVMSAISSVDYDAAVRLAYKASGKSVTFDAFKAKYLRETSEMIAKKNPYIAAIKPMPNTVSTSQVGLRSVEYDAAAKLAYKASGMALSFDAFKATYLLETSEMVAKKNPYTTVSTAQAGLRSVEYDAAAKLAYQDSNKAMPFEAFKVNYLRETSAMIAAKNPYTQNKPKPPTHEISAESFMKQPVVKVVQKVKPKPKLPLASPLARLLAEELGLELTTIGKGSGKNGKILIEDVRSFQSKIEKARDAIAKKQPYFATANV